MPTTRSATKRARRASRSRDPRPASPASPASPSPRASPSASPASTSASSPERTPLLRAAAALPATPSSVRLHPAAFDGGRHARTSKIATGDEGIMTSRGGAMCAALQAEAHEMHRSHHRLSVAVEELDGLVGKLQLLRGGQGASAGLPCGRDWLDVNALQAATRALDSEENPSVEFALGVLGIASMPEALCEQQRETGGSRFETCLQGLKENGVEDDRPAVNEGEKAAHVLRADREEGEEEGHAAEDKCEVHVSGTGGPNKALNSSTVGDTIQDEKFSKAEEVQMNSVSENTLDNTQITGDGTRTAEENSGAEVSSESNVAAEVDPKAVVSSTEAENGMEESARASKDSEHSGKHDNLLKQVDALMDDAVRMTAKEENMTSGAQAATETSLHDGGTPTTAANNTSKYGSLLMVTRTAMKRRVIQQPGQGCGVTRQEAIAATGALAPVIKKYEPSFSPAHAAEKLLAGEQSACATAGEIIPSQCSADDIPLTYPSDSASNATRTVATGGNPAEASSEIVNKDALETPSRTGLEKNVVRKISFKLDRKRRSSKGFGSLRRLRGVVKQSEGRNKSLSELLNRRKKSTSHRESSGPYNNIAGTSDVPSGVGALRGVQDIEDIADRSGILGHERLESSNGQDKKESPPNMKTSVVGAISTLLQIMCCGKEKEEEQPVDDLGPSATYAPNVTAQITGIPIPSPESGNAMLSGGDAGSGGPENGNSIPTVEDAVRFGPESGNAMPSGGDTRRVGTRTRSTTHVGQRKKKQGSRFQDAAEHRRLQDVGNKKAIGRAADNHVNEQQTKPKAGKGNILGTSGSESLAKQDGSKQVEDNGRALQESRDDALYLRPIIMTPISTPIGNELSSRHKQFLTKCELALSSILICPESKRFRDPVQLNQLPGYLRIVQRPMDLIKVDQLLKDGIITTPIDFLEHLCIIESNAVLYYHRASKEFADAIRFGEFVRQKVKPICDAWKLKHNAEQNGVPQSKKDDPESGARIANTRSAAHMANVPARHRRTRRSRFDWAPKYKNNDNSEDVVDLEKTRGATTALQQGRTRRIRKDAGKPSSSRRREQIVVAGDGAGPSQRHAIYDDITEIAIPRKRPKSQGPAPKENHSKRARTDSYFRGTGRRSRSESSAEHT